MQRRHRPSQTFLGFAILAVAAAIYAGAQIANHDRASTETHIQRFMDGLLPDSMRGAKHSGPMKLDQRMLFYHVPGVSIAYVHGAKISWARGFGQIRLGGPTVSQETMFQSGSISKPVAAMAAMSLVQSERINLDADVSQYLRSWKIPSNDMLKKSKVTLRELLAHTAGINVEGFDGYSAGTPVPSLLQVLNGERPANSPPILAEFVPGTKWQYSGGGYTIVQQILIDLSGETFPELVSRLVLFPLEMRRSTYQRNPAPTFGTDIAMPYDEAGKEVAGGFHVYPELAAAGLWSTPSDLARLGIEVQNSLAGRSNRVLSPATTRIMLTPATTPQMRKDSGDDWALGWTVSGTAAHPYFYKGGANAGYRAMMILYEQGDGAIVMTNGDGGAELIQEILLGIAHEYNWPDYKPQE